MKRALALLLAIGMVLSPAILISGGVQGSGPFIMEGSVLTDQNKSVVGALVVAENTTSGERFSAYTNETGNFAFSVLPGVYNLTVTLENFSADIVYHDVSVPLPAGTLFNFTMEETLGKMSGFVTDGSVPVNGALVHLSNELFNYTATSVAPLGQYEIVGVQPGVYVAYSEKLGYNRDNYPAPVEIVRGVTAEINFTMEEQPASVFGKVFNQNNNPLKGVRVSISSPDFDSIVVTDEDGNYTFTGLAAGDYKMTYELDGYTTEKVTVSLGPYEERRLDMVLERAQTNQTAVLFGFDLPHSLMLVGLMVGIILVTLGVVMTLRVQKRPERLARIQTEDDDVKPKE